MGSTPATAAPNRVGNSTCLSEWSNHLERFGALTPPGRETKAHDHRPWVLEACQPVGDGVQTCKSDEYRVRAWPEARGASGGPGGPSPGASDQRAPPVGTEPTDARRHLLSEAPAQLTDAMRFGLA
ncbi:uncharacterized protein EHS24_004502 [Apiotrichum porosum]|uniref:Uncharacterized protein n=1 Tax=Apiotrichum porosum TaxID=105984 RepID=A0A427Y5A6_9TREE|nr:uncharacterized protein EHS24_004502 [Apiotrichum porosum]RSH86264.1 hypothetical protein EHS24_004502 [Apiotrichum porosum]